MIFLVLIGLAISIYIFQSVNNKKAQRREERHQRIKEKQEQLFRVLEDNRMKKEQKDEGSDTTMLNNE